MSQQGLASALGITFQQVQKYEKAHNRISAARFYRIAQILDVPVSYFYDDFPGAAAATPEHLVSKSLSLVHLIASRREARELVKAFISIPDQQARKKLLSVVAMVANMMQPKQGSSENLPALKKRARQGSGLESSATKSKPVALWGRRQLVELSPVLINSR